MDIAFIHAPHCLKSGMEIERMCQVHGVFKFTVLPWFCLLQLILVVLDSSLNILKMQNGTETMELSALYVGNGIFFGVNANICHGAQSCMMDARRNKLTCCMDTARLA